MLAPADLVYQSTTGTGTGNLTLAAVFGKRNFSDVFGTGATLNVFDYFISHTNAFEWERGTGHCSAANTLVRDTVLASSNANALVNFSAGTKDVTNDVPANQIAALDSGKVSKSGDTISGNLYLNGQNFLGFTASLGAGFWTASINGSNRFFVGTDAAADAWRIYTGAAGNAFVLDYTTGLITLAADPAAALGVATKQYVDNRVVAPSSIMPAGLGAGGVGSGTTYARADHVHPSFFQDYSVIQASGIDVNTLNKNGYYNLQPSSVNAPAAIAGQWIFLEVHVHSNTANYYIVQRAYSMQADPIQIWVRYCLNNSWYPWLQEYPLQSNVWPAGLGSAGAIGTSMLMARADHQHPSNFADANASPGGAGTDLNTVATAGFYSVNSPVNAPSTGDSWVHLRVQQHGGGYVLQFLNTLTVNPPQQWVRMCIGGTWQSWMRLQDSTQIATAAQYLANTAAKLLTTDQVWSAAGVLTLTDGATVTPDFSTGFDFVWTLGAAGRTLANPTNQKVGQKGIFYLVQDGTGGRTITTWGSNFKFAGGTKPTLSTAASAVDMLSYAVTSGGVYCAFQADMK